MQSRTGKRHDDRHGSGGRRVGRRGRQKGGSGAQEQKEAGAGHGHPQMARARKPRIAAAVNSFSAKLSAAGAPAVRSTVPEPAPDSGTRRAGFPDLRIGQERSTDTPPILALTREEHCACSTPEVIPPRAGAGGRPVSTAPVAPRPPSPAVVIPGPAGRSPAIDPSDAALTESRPRFGSNGRMRFGMQGLLESRAGDYQRPSLAARL